MKRLMYPSTVRLPLPQLSHLLRVGSAGIITPRTPHTHWVPSLDDCERQLTDCLNYLEGVRMLKTCTSRAPSSYELKHEIERWLRRHGRAEPNYIGNGVCIIALMLLGAPLWAEAGDINAVAGVSRPRRMQQEDKEAKLRQREECRELRAQMKAKRKAGGNYVSG